MRSYYIKVGPKFNGRCPCKKRGHRDTQRERIHIETVIDIGGRHLLAQKHQEVPTNHQKLEKRYGMMSLQSLQNWWQDKLFSGILLRQPRKLIYLQNRKYLSLSIEMLLTLGIEDCALEENWHRKSYTRPTHSGPSKGIKMSKDHRAITERAVLTTHALI